MNRKATSRGKKQILDPTQQLFMKNFFQVKDVEELGKLESSHRLNIMEADDAGLGGAAVGVGSESEVGPNLEGERELSETTK